MEDEPGKEGDEGMVKMRTAYTRRVGRGIFSMNCKILGQTHGERLEGSRAGYGWQD